MSKRTEQPSCRRAPVLSEDNINTAEGLLSEADAHEAKEFVTKLTKGPEAGSSAPAEQGTPLPPSRSGGAAASTTGADIEPPAAAAKTKPASHMSCTHNNERWRAKRSLRSKALRSCSLFWCEEPGHTHADVVRKRIARAWAAHAEERPG